MRFKKTLKNFICLFYREKRAKVMFETHVLLKKTQYDICFILRDFITPVLAVNIKGRVFFQNGQRQ